MAVAGFAATVGSAAYLISTRTKPEPDAEEIKATEAGADESGTPDSTPDAAEA
jgi:hypothetical protein